MEKDPESRHLSSVWTLRLDGLFLTLTGVAASVADIAGHFFGTGPMAKMLNSPYTIGGFEAHALAAIIGVLLLRGSRLDDRRPWHVLGISVHLLLGTANLIFWSSFVFMDVLVIGYVATALHVIFSIANAACLWRERSQ